ncbi:hypothetical protein OA101_00035 [Alphaproteobacteria bacterium]|nr:hypothetical protein [Alphaproteobacteria bacterium]
MNFSHQEYSSILEAFEGRWCSFFDVSDQPFVLMRHDVEFSVERAFELGELENQKGVKSTFNFQVCCDTYNVASNVSREKIRSLANFGHTIGLHFYASHIEDSNFEVLEKELIRQTKILEDATDLDVKTFSFHRPKSWILKDLRDDQLAGLINQYGKSFFEFSENQNI